MNGPIDDILFFISHGVFCIPASMFYRYSSFVIYQADRTKDESFDTIASQLHTGMCEIKSTNLIPYRRQNGGNYEIPSIQLKEEFGENPFSAFSLHIQTEEEISRYDINGNL